MTDPGVPEAVNSTVTTGRRVDRGRQTDADDEETEEADDAGEDAADGVR